MKELIRFFLKMGILGFGGPTAHIAMMQDELVSKQKWCDQETFMDGLALCNVLPGPASTQLGIYMGYIHKGILGGILAGLCFILPSFILITLIAYFYFTFGTQLNVNQWLYGVNPFVISMVLIAVLTMKKKMITSTSSLLLALLSFIFIYFFNINIIIVMILASCFGIFFYNTKKIKLFLFSPVILLALPTQLFTFFLQVGSFIYGGGLVIIPVIEQYVVHQMGWLTQTEFLAGITFGQITPGPVVITAAFIGFKVLGLFGSIIATIGIFLPSFLFILLTGKYFLKAKDLPIIKAALKAIHPVVIGSILASLLSLFPTAVIDFSTLGIFLLSFVLLYKYKVNTFILLFISSIVGSLLFLL